MYTKADLIKHISQMNISQTDTILIHSSMKAVGAVTGGADTVLDAWLEYMDEQGLLIFPTHTWKQINARNKVFDVINEPSCVGILTELFRKRPNVVRSWHPTHSVAAFGADAHDYIQGEEQWDTPCSRPGCWGKLFDRQAKIIFLGCGLNSNTIIHGVEEWNDIPNRLTDHREPLQVLTPDGKLIDCPSRRHRSPVPNISDNYIILEEPLISTGIATVAPFGDARTVVCDVKPMVELTSSFLKRDPDIFLTQNPIPKSWY